MDLSKLEKSPHMTPLLVRLYDSHKLYGLVKEDQPLARAELTKAVTDLFEMELSEKEQELLADVLIGLMRQAEKDLRRALSERLAKIDNVPLRLILHLANDEITVAAPVLRNSSVLSDLDLIYIIKSQGADYWQAIASRARLSEDLVNTLVDTKDTGTAIVLSGNERTALTRYALGVLTRMAKENDDIARPLLMRSEVPQELARRLYSHVGKELQDYIKEFFGIFEGEVREAVDDLILEFAEAAPMHEFMPTQEMIDAAHKLAGDHRLNMDVMLEGLKKGKLAPFIAQFAEYTNIPVQKIHDFLRQPCPKGMAIACRAFGIQKNDFSQIYLMTNRMRSKSRMVSNKDMIATLQYFDKIRPEVAARIVKKS